MFGLTALELARIQFGFTVSFHIIFPAITIGQSRLAMVIHGKAKDLHSCSVLARSGVPGEIPMVAGNSVHRNKRVASGHPAGA